MARAPRGRNLFAIDQASIESTLTEANGPLLKDRDRLLKAFEKIPVSLDSIDDIEVAQAFAQEVDDVLGEAKKARLSDGKPFKDASKTVTDFFARIESPLKATMEELSARVTQAALRQRRAAAEREAAEAAAVRAGRRAPEPEPAPAPTPIISSRGGAAVIATVAPSAAEIPLEWVVETVDRLRVDLEELRPYLTDSALELACRKHLADHGPHKLAGVGYGQVAV